MASLYKCDQTCQDMPGLFKTHKTNPWYKLNLNILGIPFQRKLVF